MTVPTDNFAAAQKQAKGVSSLGDPYGKFVVITPSDTIQFAATRGLHCSTAGTVVVDGVDGGVSVPFTVLAGVKYDYRVTRVYAASTSSIGLNGLY